jgi:hypothetical protein
VEWQRAQAAPAQPAPARPLLGAGLAALVRRVALAALAAATIALMVLGMATLVPVDSDFDVYDMLTGTLVLLLPLTLAAGFAWPPETRGVVRGICSAIALGDMTLVHVHPLFAISAAVSAASAGLLVRERPALAVRLAAGDG